MQGEPTGELATPYLTEFQARISFALACFTFVVVGMPLAIQTQRRETSIGVLLTLGIVHGLLAARHAGQGAQDAHRASIPS